MQRDRCNSGALLLMLRDAIDCYIEHVSCIPEFPPIPRQITTGGVFDRSEKIRRSGMLERPVSDVFLECCIEQLWTDDLVSKRQQDHRWLSVTNGSESRGRNIVRCSHHRHIDALIDGRFPIGDHAANHYRIAPTQLLREGVDVRVEP